MISVSISAICANARVLQRGINGALTAVIKANAYGHGAVEVGRALAQEINILAVANVNEARVLRQAGIGARIMVLSECFSADDWAYARSAQLEPVVHSQAQFEWLTQERAPHRVWIKFDSGMHRAGLSGTQVYDVVHKCRAEGIEIAALVSHLASSEDPASDAFTHEQCRVSETLATELGLDLSLANSAGCIRFGQRWSHAYYRAGISLYGMSPMAGCVGSEHGLTAAMTLRAPVIGLRELAPGEALGYNQMWHAPCATQTALLGIGYGDGVPRAAGSTDVRTGGKVYLGGVSAPILGRVSMDMISVDVSACTERVKEGDYAEIWGLHNPLERLAEAAETISYEILTHAPLARRRGGVDG